jgi:serine/threonine protein kinase
MRVTICGRGVHTREVKSIERLKRDLPSDWYAFTNLDLVLGLGKTREVDLVIVSPYRVFLIDIKEWHGKIENKDGRWYQNGEDKGPSPVKKISDICREVLPLLSSALKGRPVDQKGAVPKLEGLVVLAGTATAVHLVGLEKSKVLTLDQFVKLMGDESRMTEVFGEPRTQFRYTPLTDQSWKNMLHSFFNASSPQSPFKHGKRRFQRYIAEDEPCFEHPRDIYQEFEASDEDSKNNLGILRLWDFTKCSDGRFQTEDGRLEVAGREKQVYHWLLDRDQDFERTLLTPRLDDPDRGVRYWEIFDRRRRMARLKDYAVRESTSSLPAARVELARQLVAAVASMHRHNAAHLDLGGHSIWLEEPTSVKLSHLFAARFPDTKSLGDARYQFLASVTVPEDILGEDKGPKRRDVFLLGVAVHELLFGCIPAGDPAEWDPSIDASGQFEMLHSWIAEALEVDPGSRFSDAGVALSSFNKATAARPSQEEVISGLEALRGFIRTSRQLFQAFPVQDDVLKESDTLDVWRSQKDGESVIIKHWKSAAWGSLQNEGRTVLSFLHRASSVMMDKFPGIPNVRGVHWLGDSMAIVQDWIDGTVLDILLNKSSSELVDKLQAIELARHLVRVVDNLHEHNFSHGDIKPSNIVINNEGNPVLIDALDFTPRIDGELSTSAYAPDSGNLFERDRFAVTKIVEEICATSTLEAQDAAALLTAARECRDRDPKLATLLPLQEACDLIHERLTAPEEVLAKEERAQIAVSIVRENIGPIEPDEGRLFISLHRRPDRSHVTLSIRGAFERIEVTLNDTGNPVRARRWSLEQWRIAQIARNEFHSIDAGLTVVRADINDFSALSAVLEDPVIAAELRKYLAGATTDPLIKLPDEADELAEEDEAEDALAEEVASAPVPHKPVDVDIRALWRTLIDVENELTTDGIALLDSLYDRSLQRHKVALELETGDFDFSREDTVGVQRQDPKGNWRRIGDLDLSRSRPDLAVISAHTGNSVGSRLVEEGQRLRFVSHFEVQSLKRRTDAVDRILEGNGRAANLLTVFDPRSGVSPQVTNHVPNEEVLSSYGLNEDQEQAFRRIVRTRPVGVLQGPPGTGKTRFIAALAHYAITAGLARNVLLASQSHEAVNTAAESVLALFRKAGEDPSLLRVAMSDGQVSAPLRPFHTARVEQSYKDRFSASFAERLAVAGKALAIPEDAIAIVVKLETTLRPVIVRIADLCGDRDVDYQRINNLIETLTTLLADIEIDVDLPAEHIESEWLAVLDAVAKAVADIARKKHAVSADKIRRLRAVADLGRDFIGSVSRAERSFETFLAGTRQIVVGTCVGLGRSSLGLTATAFDLVIVDEAARCTAGELLVPLQAARWAVLVGDQAQLEPQHKAEVVNLVADRTRISKREIQRSDFERVFLTDYGRDAGARLKTQYRMLPPIGQLVSESFYPDLILEAGRSASIIPVQVLPEELKRPLVWIETDGLGSAGHEQSIGSSRINKAEADSIVGLLTKWHENESFRSWLQEQTTHQAGIGVICMYAAQRNLVDKALRQSPLAYLLDRHIKIGTVDSYQGKENPIVLLSLVRNNSWGPMEDGFKRIQDGFLATPNRINVAASRAMDCLVIIGARNRWRKGGPMSLLSSSFARRIAEGSAQKLAAEILFGADQDANRADHPSPRPRRAKGGARGNT